MIIYYSNTPLKELSIEGTEGDFLQLTDLINNTRNETVETDRANPHPYQYSLNKISVKIKPNKMVNLEVTGDELIISGDIQYLSQFSDEIKSFAENTNLGEHLHIEYYINHFFLNPNAIPLVVVRRKNFKI